MHYEELNWAPNPSPTASTSFHPVNTFVLEAEGGCALIDTSFTNSAKKILDAIDELEKRTSDVRHIILTHAHPDHIGSAAALKSATGAELYAQSLNEAMSTHGSPLDG
jgi:glyoxylase-like metal-dependent hydrolase (beta-lactamase superfamily II)